MAVGINIYHILLLWIIDLSPFPPFPKSPSIPLFQRGKTAVPLFGKRG